ncbi:DUF5686 family protein [Deminuibacter soli]|uniref:Carboxypeptidase-like regulatory domain-containing protein n=1 Tax=Deminuibacter soli TaxID=2291815 RepID=A0A3E1NIC0_9BACT|nr:DUF5686 family protein [Deminuibacter soli]RFM27621.1 carboxypeptidase-like regulatory domain-containing protein [Deminuibacter soli]
MNYSGELLVIRRKWWLTVLFFIGMLQGFAQTPQVVLSGTVKDASNGNPINNASIYVPGYKGVISTDSSGAFRVTIDHYFKQITIALVGYKRQIVNITQGKESGLDISLYSTENDLNNVTVSTKKRAKYRNKDNPAVELIRKVVANKDKNRPEHYDYVQYEKYEKLQVSLSRFSEKMANSKLLRNYHFLFENVDTTKIEGKSLVPVYLEEKISDEYYRKNPYKKKVFVKGDQKVNYGEFIDNNGVSTYLNRLYQDIDIYDNSISLFTNQFVSPISNAAPDLYMFFIRDTVELEGKKLVKLYFTPRNTNDLLFRGTMWITLDGNYAVQKLEMFTSKNINLNFVREMKIEQSFEKNPDGRFHLSKSDVMAEAGLSRNGKTNGIYGERSVSFKDYVIDSAKDDKFYEGASEVVAENSAAQTDSFWQEHRHDTLSRAEAKVYHNIDSLRNMTSYKRMMDIANLLFVGYKSFGKFEIGPANAFYSFNPVEGFRLRFGGRTTPLLSKRIYFETYGAYGFKDKKWKGYLGVTYSINNKSIYEFPLNYIRASVQRETSIPGQNLAFVQEDNFLLSFKRGNNDKWLYNDYYKLDYVHELANHLSYTFGFKYWKQTPAGQIQYIKASDGQNVDNITTSEVNASIRWAPHEQFYNNKVYRLPIINKYPILTFMYSRGIKGLFNGEYSYNRFDLRIDKRAYMSWLGYSDLVITGSYLTGQLPYPLLDIHHANQTYAYQLDSYNMMNFLEFVNDHYVALSIDHHFNGLLFNRIPLFRKLKWREVLEAKVIYGGVRDENDPSKNANVYKYPSDPVTGAPTTFTMNGRPYIEGGIGITNIFRVIRVDLVKRFTYLENPDIATWGIRVRYKFDF